MKWISMNECQPKNGANIFIDLNGGMYGEWRDKLWPDQAYFQCPCDFGGVDSKTYEVGEIDYWMGITLPKIPQDK